MSAVARIKSWTIRRKMSDASWLWDLVNLQRTIALCKGCSTYRMPWRWQQKLHYAEVLFAHGEGHCDFCRKEDAVSLYQCTDTTYYQQIQKDHALASAAQERDRALVFDRRRVF